jgi:TolB-like protein/class 3 adenylate cyclase/Tfp pilus assembly protein PilF
MKDDTDSAGHAETRRLAAIMFTDIVGFSRQMGDNEARTLRLLEVHNHVIQQAVAEHHGHVIKTAGDGFLVEFPSVVHAVQCAQHIQGQFQTHNAEKEKSEQLHVRIGIHLGDIVVQPNGDVLGDGVNIASRLQTLAEPDTICISQKVYEEVAKKLALGTVVALGRPRLKNIAERFQVYALLSQPPQGVRQALQVQRLKLKQWRRALQGVAALLVLGLVGGGAIALRDRYFPPSPALPLPDKPSIAVLPFVNMSGDPEQEYFSDGLTEDLITDLSKVSGLFIIARNSVFTYKGKAVKVADIGKELGVRYVLEGSARKADKQVRITAQLVEATSGYHLWAERYDRPLQDIFALQDEIVQQMIANLQVKVFEAELERVKRIPTNNLTAYDYLLRGAEYYRHLTKETNAQARQLWEKAIELDPKYAEAYAALGWTYWLEWIWQWSQDPKTLERAFALAQRTIALDDSLPGAHQLLGSVYVWQKQYDLAIAEGERAIALDPNDANGHVTLGFILAFAGRPEEALGLIEKAIRLNPRYHVGYLFQLGHVYHLLGRNEEAIATLKKLLIRNPNYLGAHIRLVFIYSELGREEEARAEAAEVLRLNPDFSAEVFMQRLTYTRLWPF